MEKEKVVSISSNKSLEKQLSKYKLESIITGLVGTSGIALSALNISSQDLPSFVGLLVGPLLISTGTSGLVSSIDNYKNTKQELKNIKRR